jgi:branched-chain amino acid transport system permease protein
VPPGRRAAIGALAALALAALLPFTGDEYRLVLATDILVLALFASSLQFVMGTGGMASFGHAAYFGLGAYAAALAVKHGMPMEGRTGVVAVRGDGGRVRRRRLLRPGIGRLPRDADARFRADRLVDRLPVGRCHRRVQRRRRRLAGAVAREQDRLLLVRAALAGTALAAIAWIAHTPFGYTLRACRDSPLRAAAIGIDIRRTQWIAFAMAGGFAGLAGGLYAFSKGSISPETLGIPRSVDALVMVLLGGLNALAGPLLGAAAFTWLADTLARVTEYWHAVLGAAIVAIVVAAPMGSGCLQLLRTTRPISPRRAGDARYAHASERSGSSILERAAWRDSNFGSPHVRICSATRSGDRARRTQGPAPRGHCKKLLSERGERRACRWPGSRWICTGSSTTRNRHGCWRPARRVLARSRSGARRGEGVCRRRRRPRISRSSASPWSLRARSCSGG